ncbi:MAG TPA: MFS transporter [Longimicrobiales bacterium]|nr:MFS transporter [Longimicrobiales bacterium]
MTTLEAAPLSAKADTIHKTAWFALALLATAELMGMSLWFTASAVSPELQQAWGLSAAEAGWLTTVVQLGFVAGTAVAALLNLPDLVPSRWYFPVAAFLAASANAALLTTSTFAVALTSRFFTGFFLAGVYPPAMKMIATWFAPARAGTTTRRGLAIGTVVGALTIGKALPYLLRAFEQLSFRIVISSASLAALLAAVLVTLTYRDGPYFFGRRPFSWGLVGVVVKHRETRLALGGYLGHMWELYACWTASSLFFFDVFRDRGTETGTALTQAGLAGFATIAAGGLGCVIAGVWADRMGRENIAAGAMVVSGLCALTIGWLGSFPIWLVVAVALVWGFAVVADSAQFSALITELSPGHAVGTALTLQVSLGFLLTAFSIWFTLAVQTRFGWGVAFSMLAIGPAIGTAQMLRLKRIR